MGVILLEIINNRIIQAAALAWAIAQAIKVLLTLAISRKFDHTRVLGSGGMPVFAFVDGVRDADGDWLSRRLLFIGLRAMRLLCGRDDV